MIINCGSHADGTPYRMYIDRQLYEEVVIPAKKRNKKNFDYVAIISGTLVGVGKSSFSRHLAHALDDNFNNSKICFTADEFIKKTNLAKPYSCIVLDESFEALNTGVTRSKDFLKILNHLQLIRSKRLYLLINLPSFFDLSKNIALFRANHFFLIYCKHGTYRSYFLFFDRQAKQRLYLRGKKELNLNASKSTFKGRFPKIKDLAEETEYESLKKQHLLQQSKKLEEEKVNPNLERDKAIYELKNKGYLGSERIGEVFGISKRQVNRIIAIQKDKRAELDSDAMISNKNILNELEKEAK